MAGGWLVDGWWMAGGWLRTSADCNVSCDVVSLVSSGRHSIGSSALDLASTVMEGGTFTSGLFTVAEKATGVGSGFDNESKCEVS